MFHHQKHSLISGLLATLLISFTAFAHAQSGGNGGGNAGGNGVVADLSAVEADIAALQADVSALQSETGGIQAELDVLQAESAAAQAELMALADSIAELGVQEVDADCTADSGALQAAIDAAPPAGAIINVSGVCESASIYDKANILLNGGELSAGNGVSGLLLVEAARNIQLAGINAGEFYARYVSSVFTTGLKIAGNVRVVQNSSLLQFDGEVNIAGNLFAGAGGTVDIGNGAIGSIGSVSLSRNSQVFNNTCGGSIEVGSVFVFSGGHYLAQTNDEDCNGTVTISGDIFVQRTAAVLLVGPNTRYNGLSIKALQNSVFDVIGVPEANLNPEAQFLLRTGSGARLLFSDSNTVREATCDGSAWADGDLVCAE